MADMALIQGTIASLRLAGDIAKGMLDLKNFNDVSLKVAELQAAIISAQSSAIDANSAHSSLIDKVRDLENEVVRLKNWDSEKLRYKLKSVRGGTVYALKKTEANSEPPHYLCANCYQNGKRAFLNPTQKGRGEFFCLTCGNCGVSISTGTMHAETAEYAE